MALDWTTVIVGVTTGAAGVAGGMYSARRAARTAKDQMDHDRGTRREERRYEARVEVYVELIEFLRRERLKVGFVMEGWTKEEPFQIPDDPWTDDDLIRQAARRAAFSSRPVRNLKADWDAVIHEFIQRARRLRTMQAQRRIGVFDAGEWGSFPEDEFARMKELCDRANMLSDEMEEQIANELAMES